MPTVNRASKKVQRDVRRAGVAAGAQVGGGTLFTEQVLVVNQKAKLIEVNAEYVVYDQHGRQIGAVREVGQSFMKAMAVPADTRTHRLQVVDLDGRVLIALTRPAKIFRSKVIVRNANGAEIGQIVQKNFGFIGKFRFVSSPVVNRWARSTPKAGMRGPQHSGRDRNRDRPDHQGVGGAGQGVVYDGRQLRRSDSPVAG